MSLRSGSNQKRQAAQEQYNQERGFETFLQGANQQRLQQKKQIEKNDQRALSKDRKKWQDLQDQAASKQNQQQQQQQQQIKGDAQRQKWNKIPPSKEEYMKEAKVKHQQQFDKNDGEQIMNYLQTMDKAELEMLRQSLVVQNNKNQKKGDQHSSPNKAMMVEEDEILKQYQYSQDDEQEYEDLDKYKEEGYDNIEEEIEENTGENQSELYQPNFNERSYHTQYQNNKKQISQKARPISAIQASSNTYNSQPNQNLKNYESHRNFVTRDSRNQSDEKANQREIVYNEETKQLNSNPFSMKSDGRRLSENFQNQNKKQTEDFQDQNEPVYTNIVYQQQRKKEAQTVKNQDRDKDLEDIVMKLSKMNQGTRQELVTLIDKIGNGELDVSAIKSLLFMQNNNSNQSINTNKSQSVKDQSQHGRVQSQNYQSSTDQKEKPPQQKPVQNKFKNYQDDISVKRDLFGEEEAKPETIKFSRDQFSISLAKGLLQNTQELEKTLNLGNDDSNKQIQKVSFTDQQSNQQVKLKPQKVIEKLEETQNSVRAQKQKNQVSYQNQDDNSRYQQNEQDYSYKTNQNDIGKQQKSEIKIKEPNLSEDEYFDEDDLDDVPINQNFYNKLNKNKLKDTLQLKNQKEQIIQLSDQKKPNEELNSERSLKKQESKQSQDNKTYNLSKNRDKIQQIQLKDIKEQKGEVFIIIRVISTWGSAHLVGLTEIKVYDEEGCNIKIKPEDLMIEGGLQTSSRNIYRICDGVYDTIDSEHMWLGTMPDPPKCMEIGIKFKSSKGIGALRVWNYNKSLIDSVKGIKEIEITRNNNLIWVGQIKKGIGKESENYGDLIKFKEDIVLDDEKKVFRVSQQQGVVPTKLSANIPKDIKSSKQEEKPPVTESLSKLPQKKTITPLQDDADVSKQGRHRGSNLNSQSSSTTPQASSRIRSAQQKPQPNSQSKDNDELDSQQQIQQDKTQKKSVVKDTEVDTLSKALQSKNQVQKSGSIIARTKNETAVTSSNTSLSGQSKLIGASSFETSKNKLKLDDNKTPKSQTGSGKTTPSNALLNSINQTSTEPSVDPASTSKITKKGPKVLNVFEEKQKGQQISSQSSLKDPYHNESPIQKRTNRIEFKEDRIDLNEEKSDIQIFKKLDQNQTDHELKDPKKKSSDESSSGKVDDFMENVKFFNATHQGRFQPAERERILQNQAQDVQQAVKQTLQSLNPFFQQNLGKKGIEDDIQFKSEDDSGDYSKIDVFMKQSSKLQQQLTASIQRNNQERQSQQNKLSKPILQDEDSLLDQILREENQSDEKDYQKQQKIFAPKSPQVEKPNIFQENKQIEAPLQTQNQDISANLDDTRQFEREMNKLLESKNSPFMGDILKSVQKENRQIEQQNLQINTQQFQIPMLPEGKSIKIEIYTTWGDNYYVGLTGIEFFDSKGNLIQISNPKKQVKADPSDINILPEYGEDPRTCDKLVDGVYLTCDDLHMWLAPYQQGKINYLYIDFLSVQKLSMIRIWNYNKSRIHSFRGARDIKILLDDVPIFAGSIQRAQGIQYYAPQDCEYIMFTDNESIIQQIENNDWLNRYQLTEIEEEQNVIDKMMQTQSLQRPTTGNNYNTNSQTSLSSQPRSQTGKDGRPITSAKTGINQITNQQKGDDLNKKLNTKANQIIEYQMNQGTQKSLKRGIKCQKIKIFIHKSWEDKFYVGLTGIEVYDEYGQKIPLKESQLKARPKDLNEISGYHGDQRTLDKLIDGVNLTTNEKHMWLVQLLEQPQNYLQIDFMEEKIISGIKIWNYNKQQSYNDCKSVDQYRGAKIISIVADENIQITPQQGILLRKAPGRDLFDYGQMIALPFESGWTQEVIQSLQLPTQVNSQIIQEYDTLYLPRGFCFRFNIHSTWGDAHYCGLNGIEFYDSFGNPIIQKRLAEFKLGAEPASVNILPGCQGDIRTIDKLVNCQNDTFDDRNMWLAPFINSRSDKNVICPHLKMNTIYLFFEKPVIISAINFWNYSKTPSRGVREIEIFLDDKLLFRGYLKKAPTQEQYTKDSVPLFNTVIFNRNQEILQKIKPVVYNEDRQQQNVIFSNEGKVEGGSKTQLQMQPQTQNDASNHLVRPQTKVSGMKLMQ
ncbi:hypothetical protein TTHERM_00052450 (macronuclear) [Tetrahymena thermophila SB210]|uniref:KATNIP domain-containing protein n=1 Tax=Tetrahymena thermophila (strain SB210) TaxID=312017 RepID=Q23CU5_TETTS|nr:hypothetical protein TTHERM_00052450 [Tetrahymena thermophila SB210]EAR94456.2 hypothetical protein TTHERM_00052450 [Tetrahymena thermophila SB210]|eukprot:XP_001014941.2 hypothetical protein TTHERM_00052450 [Tetrahymena thermophila SB210]